MPKQIGYTSVNKRKQKPWWSQGVYLLGDFLWRMYR